MEYSHITYTDAEAQVARFGGTRPEAHAIIHARPGIPFPDQLSAILSAATSLATDLGGLHPVFKRYFLSDIANQAGMLPESEPCATSRIQQSPLDGSKIALWMVFHADADFHDLGDGAWEDSRGRIIVGDGNPCGGNSHDLATRHLARLADLLESRGASMLDHCTRTWFLVRDIDLNYDGVVTGRNEEFARRGLSRYTHFISSTGIEGRPAGLVQTVAFNALCDTRLQPGQMGFVYGASHLNPTIEYGVAFERGTTIDYADRRHVYISGTASIDNKGDVVHSGDISAQTRRMIENIMVLLDEAGCRATDIAHLIVYLRDAADYRTVTEIYDELLPGIPRVIVLAPVCRPGWLVETECMAIRHASNPQYADF